MITITIQTDTASQALEDIRALAGAVAEIASKSDEMVTLDVTGAFVDMIKEMPIELRDIPAVAEVLADEPPPPKEKKPRGKKVETVVVAEPVQEAPAPISDFVEEVEAAIPPTLQDLRDAMRSYMVRLMHPTGGKGLDENTAALKVKDVLLALGYPKAGEVPEDKRAAAIAALGRAE